MILSNRREVAQWKWIDGVAVLTLQHQPDSIPSEVQNVSFATVAFKTYIQEETPKVEEREQYLHTPDPIPRRPQQERPAEGDLSDEFASVDESLKSYDTLQFEELLLELS